MPTISIALGHKLSRVLLRSAAAVAAFLVSIFPLAGADGHFGLVSGQVSNDSTKAYLQSALVVAQDTGRSAATDQQGQFELSLPVGLARLDVSYPGLDPQTITVSVTEAQTATVTVKLTAAIYKLDSFIVSGGQREGMAKAVALQQRAPNVKSVVSSDSFGNVADGNVGDFMQQLSGVNANYVGADVRSITIRGVNESLNSVTLDGTRMASAPSNGVDRTFEFEQVSLGLIENIELTKAPTPDMDADSIGGSVNMVTKSAFDRADPDYFTYSIGGTSRLVGYTRTPELIREPLRNVGPSINLAYSKVLGEKRNIGVLLTFTMHSQPQGLDTAALLSFENALKDNRYIYSVQVPRPAGAPRSRLALGAKVDYKWSASTVLTLNTLCNFFHENNDTRIFTQLTSQAVGNFKPSYTSYFEEVIANANSASTTLTTTDDKFGRTFAITPSGRTRLPGLLIDYGASLSNSLTEWEIGPAHHGNSPFGSPIGRAKGQVSATLRTVGFTVDRTRDAQWPVVTQTAGADMYNLNNYSQLSLLQNDRGALDIVTSGQINAKKVFERLPVPAFVKTGASFRRQRRTNWTDARTFNYVGPDRIAGSADDNVGQFLLQYRTNAEVDHGYRTPPWLDSYRVAENLKGHPELWTENLTASLTSYLSGHNRLGVEDVSAAYAMGHAKFGPLSVLAGARVEDTSVSTRGPRNYLSPSEIGLRNAYAAANPGGVVSDDETRRRLNAQYSTIENRSGQYRKIFPGLHFKYEPVADVITRLSYSSGIGRPSFSQIIPNTTASDTARTVVTANPDLRPQFADNFDVTVEYYFRPAGYISFGAFLKEVDDFIFSKQRILPSGDDNGFDGQFAGYTLTTPANAGHARYRGFEFNYNQQFTFLPGVWRGLGAGVNWTKTESYGDFGGATSTSLVAGVVPHMVNGYVNFTYRGFNVRFTGIWRQERLIATNANAALLQYQVDRQQWNVKSRYTFSKRLGFFLDLENITSTPITESYIGRRGDWNQTRITSPKVVLGVTGRF
ncbi:MAG: TonB-dependent receptor [Opitutaceae bacterium]